MLIAHIALTPLAGAPIALVHALNKYTKHHARLINLNPGIYGNRTFPEDLIWSNDNDREACINIIKKADIIHLHHYFNIETDQNPFGFNFRSHALSHCCFIRHIHSAPGFLGQEKNDAVLHLDKIPKLVVPHPAERYFPQARVVPNLVNIEGEGETGNGGCKIVFAPSRYKEGAWITRWETKGAPEVIRILKNVGRKRSDVDIEIIINKPYEESIHAKRRADIVIDDVVTGSYHLGGLEGLALGKPTVTHVDNRTGEILCSLTGCDRLPFLNIPLEHLQRSLDMLSKDGEGLKGIGEESKAWFTRYYKPDMLVNHYIEAYEDLLAGANVFDTNTQAQRRPWFQKSVLLRTIALSDVLWTSRKMYHQTLYGKMREKIRMVLYQTGRSIVEMIGTERMDTMPVLKKMLVLCAERIRRW